MLQKLQDGFRLEFEHFDWSSDRYKKEGAYIPEGGLEQLKKFDAIFFGAVGAPDVPDHISLWGLRLPICQGSRPVRECGRLGSCPGIARPDKGRDTDWVIVRENRG